MEDNNEPTEIIYKTIIEIQSLNYCSYIRNEVGYFPYHRTLLINSITKLIKDRSREQVENDFDNCVREMLK